MTITPVGGQALYDALFLLFASLCFALGSPTSALIGIGVLIVGSLFTTALLFYVYWEATPLSSQLKFYVIGLTLAAMVLVSVIIMNVIFLPALQSIGQSSVGGMFNLDFDDLFRGLGRSLY